jgi:hypothetical protein
MAWGKHAPHTVESARTGADTQRLGIDDDVADRPAHAWEIDDDASWEPVVPDTWEPPEAGTSAEAPEAEAAWSDAARSAREWADAGANLGEVPAADEAGHSPIQPSADVRPAGPADVRPAGAADLRPTGPQERAAEREDEGEDDAGAPDGAPPARMALGLASLAAQRMRSEVPVGDGLITGLGLLRQTAEGLMALGERLLTPASRVASVALRGAAAVPVAGVPVRVALRSGEWLASSAARVRDRAQEQGREVIAGALSRVTPDYSAQAREAAESSTTDGPADVGAW